MIRPFSISRKVAGDRSAPRRFLRNRQASVNIMFGFLLLPMIGAIGLAVDFGQALTARNKAQIAADAAALQAAGVAKDLIQKSDGSTASSAAALAEAKTRAEDLFDAYAAQSNLTNYTFAASVTRTGQAIEASGNFTIQTSNFIAPIFGVASYKSVGSAKSSSSLPTYVNVYAAVDVSQSMGLGATQADMAKLYSLTGPDNCVFGCHVISNEQIKHNMKVTNQTVAKNNNIDLRIDILRRALKDMINTAESDAGSSATYQFGFYTMGANPSNNSVYKLTELASLTGDYAALETKTDGIDLGSNNKDGQGDSYFKEPLGELAGKVKTTGDGSSREKAKGFVFIMTDGVRDMVSNDNCASGSYKPNHCMGTIEPSDCKAFKDKNLTVGVLYTTYLPVYANPSNPSSGYRSEYSNLVYNNGIYAIIASKLKDCASPGWFYEASDTTGINKAVKAMFEQITVTPLLVN